MVYRKRIYYSSQQIALMWERYHRGDSLTNIKTPNIENTAGITRIGIVGNSIKKPNAIIATNVVKPRIEETATNFETLGYFSAAKIAQTQKKTALQEAKYIAVYANP